MALNMKSLPVPDSHYLSAAQGWLELGNHLEANDELERITPELRAHPDVLEVRWHIYAHAKKWGACVDIASAIVKLNFPSGIAVSGGAGIAPGPGGLFWFQITA
jgi:hypothetical protein